MDAQGQLIAGMIREHALTDAVLWYYTPMALPFTNNLAAQAVVYDCMDELSAFAGAPQRLRYLEQEVFSRADVVFTGGQSLYEAKRTRHANVHAFPSSVDVAHFATARTCSGEPPDHKAIGRPRIGFFGVIDEGLAQHPTRDGAAAAAAW